ncbi:hypothetical protein B0H11DRAFT_1905098 [Mycena galericulata]|nr:hypothetical protein B0H11DRAFT_1905098 [Mycena galericulata]
MAAENSGKKARAIHWSKKKSPAQQVAMLEVQAARSLQKSSKANTTRRPLKRVTTKQIEQKLKTTQSILSNTQSLLDDSQKQVVVFEKALRTTQQQLFQARVSLQAALKHNSNLYRLLQVERHKTQHYQLTKLSLSIKLKESAAALASVEQSLSKSLSTHNDTLEAAASAKTAQLQLQQSTDTTIAWYKRALGESQKKIKSLQMKNLHSRCARAKADEKATKSRITHEKKWKLVEKGIYTPAARSLARVIHKFSCSQDKVGSVIRLVTKAAGIEFNKHLWREGFPRVQLGHEMSQADGITLSTDTTSVQGENYESGFVMINKGTSHKMRIFSLTSTISHSSETQLANIKHQIALISVIYKRSPLGQRSKYNFEVHNFLRLLQGMHGDHVADMKKTSHLMGEWKSEVCQIMLSYEAISQMDEQKIIDIVLGIQNKNIQEVGGAEEREKLTNEKKDLLSKSSMDTLMFHIGEEAFEKLTQQEKCDICRFFWAGCSMHKELNCCRALNEGMNEYYDENPDIEPPVLLANCNNDVTIQLAEETGNTTAAVQRALQVLE